MPSIMNIKEIPQNLKYKYIDSGCFGSCYQTKDGKCFKLFRSDFSEYEYNIKNLSKYKSENIVFPETLVYLDNKFIGYITDYVKGQRFDKLDKKENMNTLLLALTKLEKELFNLAKEKISMSDCNSRNAYYTDDKIIKIVDTDMFEIIYLSTDNIVYSCSLAELYYLIHDSIILFNPLNIFLHDSI